MYSFDISADAGILFHSGSNLKRGAMLSWYSGEWFARVSVSDLSRRVSSLTHFLWLLESNLSNDFLYCYIKTNLKS